MKCFLLGSCDKNAGPDNVNRSLIANSHGEIICTRSKDRSLRVIESVLKLLTCNRVLISGCCSRVYYTFLRIINKKYCYLMHGCVAYENEINRLNLPNKYIDNENLLLKDAEHIICVSEGYKEWVKCRYPDYADKINFVNNGICLRKRKKGSKVPYTIAVSGGNRCIKNNNEIAKAVKVLNDEGIPCKMYIFGRKYPGNDKIEENDHVMYCGHLDKEQYYKRLDEIDCFVLNSEVEPFGLVVADALNCNCSLLMSQHVGSRCIMETKECDIIQNPHDIDEIVGKLKYLFEHNNSDRLYESIDIQDCTENSAFIKLKEILEGPVK